FARDNYRIHSLTTLQTILRATFHTIPTEEGNISAYKWYTITLSSNTMPPKQTPDSSGGSASTAINLDSSILTSLSSLLAASQKTLSNPSLSSSSSSHIPSDAPLPLDLLHDTATLLRAQTTKLGIALRPPVTAEAVDAI